MPSLMIIIFFFPQPDSCNPWRHNASLCTCSTCVLLFPFSQPGLDKRREREYSDIFFSLSPYHKEIVSLCPSPNSEQESTIKCSFPLFIKGPTLCAEWRLHHFIVPSGSCKLSQSHSLRVSSFPLQLMACVGMKHEIFRGRLKSP